MENNICYNNIYENKYYKNESEIDEIITITAFMEIGRENWLVLNRNKEDYIDSFKKMLFLNKNMIIFMDDKYINLIDNYCDENKIIIPINANWLKENSESWKKIDIAKNIMNSDKYKELLNVRINNGNPENIYPEYNTINHSKIDFIKYAIDYNFIKKNQFICWCDFGYYHSILHNNHDEFPYVHLDLNRFNTNKLNFFLRNKISLNDFDMIYTLVKAPEIFTGSFFGGNSKVMLELYKIYHECLNELYLNNISDDDQHVYLRCYLKKPELFELFLSKDKWPQALTCFQKKIENRFQFIQNYIGKIVNGLFAEIGVCHGSLSEFILENNDSCKLYCVDPYINYNEYNDACKIEVGDQLFELTSNKLITKFQNRIKMIRKFSNSCNSCDVPNDLDFVYIDGNHCFKYVLEDIMIWFDKLKLGGFIICDDANDDNENLRNENGDVFVQWNENSYGYYGVIHACKIFCKNNNINYFKFDNQIIIYKPFSKQKSLQKTVAFLSNKLTLRGTEVALYDYADYNEKILGNKSIIITRDFEKVKYEYDVDIQAYNKFHNRTI
jgi:hypothetical protein